MVTNSAYPTVKGPSGGGTTNGSARRRSASSANLAAGLPPAANGHRSGPTAAHWRKNSCSALVALRSLPIRRKGRGALPPAGYLVGSTTASSTRARTRLGNRLA